MVRVTGIGAVLALGVLVAGCEDKPKDAPTTSTAASTAAPMSSVAVTPTPMASASAPVAAKMPPGPPRGAAGMLFAATRGLTLDDAQKSKVDDAMKQLKDVDPQMQDSTKDAMKALNTELAAEVKAGKIETSKLTPLYDATDKAVADDEAKDVDAVNALHAALTPEQRKAVAADLRAKQAMVDEKVAKQEANKAAAGDKAKQPDILKPGAAENHVSHELRWMTSDLGLDEKQQKDVDALGAKDPKEKDHQKRFGDLATDFEKDTFDAKKSDLFKAKTMREPLEDRTTLIDKLTKILKPEQREKLAAKIEKGPMMRGGPGGGPGMMGMGHGSGGMMGPGGPGGPMGPGAGHPATAPKTP